MPRRQRLPVNTTQPHLFAVCWPTQHRNNSVLKPGLGTFSSGGSARWLSNAPTEAAVLVNILHILQWALRHNPLKVDVILSTTFSIHPPMNVLGYSSQPASVAATVNISPSLCRVSVIISWTAVQSVWTRLGHHLRDFYIISNLFIIFAETLSINQTPMLTELFYKCSALVKHHTISLNVMVTNLQSQYLGSSFSFSSPTVLHHPQ